jgi:hypothetical protein
LTDNVRWRDCETAQVHEAGRGDEGVKVNSRFSSRQRREGEDLVALNF